MFTSELQSFSFVNLLDILEIWFLTIPKKTTPQFQKGSSPKEKLRQMPPNMR